MIIDEWIVAFEPADSVWWHRFLAPGFGHCWAFGFCQETGHWVWMNPAFERVMIGIATPRLVEGWFDAMNVGRLRLVRVPCQDVPAVRPRLLVTCAGAVASLLGLRRYPLTPWGLFRMVRAIGAQELVPYGDVQEPEGPGAECRGIGAAAAG